MFIPGRGEAVTGAKRDVGEAIRVSTGTPREGSDGDERLGRVSEGD